jgi:hypothetical protein
VALGGLGVAGRRSKRAAPFAGQALSEGGDALETWLRSRDSNVALRLSELVADWRRI